MFNKFLTGLKTNHKHQMIAEAVGLCVLTIGVIGYSQVNYVTVFEDGQERAKFTTFKEEQAELLTQAELTLGKDDVVVVTDKGQKVRVDVSRAFPISITANGETVDVNVVKEMTVREALDKAAVEYKETDKFSTGLDEAVTSDLALTVVRCETKVITETEAIPYDTETEKTDSMYKGATSVKQEGVEGEQTHTYTVDYEDGVEVARVLNETVVTKEPQTEIKLVGTKKREITSTASYGKRLSAEELEGARCLTVTATAYSSSSDGGARTATGKVPCYGTVAVDPRVIPLGTKMYIVSPNGGYVYGYCFAGDTGGAIKGNKVDLFMNSSSETRSFGRRTMLVYILD